MRRWIGIVLLGLFAAGCARSEVPPTGPSSSRVLVRRAVQAVSPAAARYLYVFDRAEVWDPACPSAAVDGDGEFAYLLARVDSRTDTLVWQWGPYCLHRSTPPPPSATRPFPSAP